MRGFPLFSGVFFFVLCCGFCFWSLPREGGGGGSSINWRSDSIPWKAKGRIFQGWRDAPALASANVGIGMGIAGLVAAIVTAGIVLMTDDLSKVAYTISLSRGMLSVVKQNVPAPYALMRLACFCQLKA